MKTYEIDYLIKEIAHQLNSTYSAISNTSISLIDAKSREFLIEKTDLLLIIHTKIKSGKKNMPLSTAIKINGKTSLLKGCWLGLHQKSLHLFLSLPIATLKKYQLIIALKRLIVLSKKTDRLISKAEDKNTISKPNTLINLKSVIAI